MVDRPSLQNNAVTQARVRRELPAVVDYQRGYGIPGDTLAMGSAADVPMTQTTLDAAAASIDPAPAGTTSEIQRFGRLRPGTADTQRAVVIVTDQPNAWLGRLPSAAAGQGRATQYFIIDTNASGTVPSTLTGAGPWVLPDGGSTADSVAVAMARAWSHAADTGWTG